MFNTSTLFFVTGTRKIKQLNFVWVAFEWWLLHIGLILELSQISKPPMEYVSAQIRHKHHQFLMTKKNTKKKKRKEEKNRQNLKHWMVTTYLTIANFVQCSASTCFCTQCIKSTWSFSLLFLNQTTKQNKKRLFSFNSPVSYDANHYYRYQLGVQTQS